MTFLNENCLLVGASYIFSKHILYTTDDFFITVENVKCLLKITGLPENVEVLEGTVQALDNKGYLEKMDTLRLDVI